MIISEQKISDYLTQTVLPVFAMVRKEAPSLAIGTFCVLLATAQSAERFGARGDPSGIVAEKLGISNLPKHFEHLGNGSEIRPGLMLVELQRHAQNRRITLPKLTDKGLTLVANIAAGLRHQPPSLVRYPKEEKLREAKSPEEVADFSDDDFNFNKIEWLDQNGDDTSSSSQG